MGTGIAVWLLVDIRKWKYSDENGIFQAYKEIPSRPEYQKSVGHLLGIFSDYCLHFFIIYRRIFFSLKHDSHNLVIDTCRHLAVFCSR